MILVGNRKPTPPGMRVRTGRFAKIPGRSRENDQKQFFEKLTVAAL
jgi:hypothetical protein